MEDGISTVDRIRRTAQSDRRRRAALRDVHAALSTIQDGFGGGVNYGRVALICELTGLRSEADLAKLAVPLLEGLAIALKAFAQLLHDGFTCESVSSAADEVRRLARRLDLTLPQVVGGRS